MRESGRSAHSTSNCWRNCTRRFSRHPGTGPGAPKAWRKSWPCPGAGGWLLESDARPIGFVLARFTLDEGEILLTGILPTARNQGHGARLMAAAIAAARAAGIAKLFLEHAELNAAAARLYQRMGFVQIGRRLQYYGGHRPSPDAPLASRYDAVTRMLDLSALDLSRAEPAPSARVDTGGSK